MGSSEFYSVWLSSGLHVEHVYLRRSPQTPSRLSARCSLQKLARVGIFASSHVLCYCTDDVINNAIYPLEPIFDSNSTQTLPAETGGTLINTIGRPLWEEMHIYSGMKS